jgi:hypothetical protein
MTRRDLEALRRKRDAAARKADELTDQIDRWPNVERATLRCGSSTPTTGRSPN